MKKYLFAFISLALGLSCQERESVITIVDIGYLDRNGIAQELNIINQHSPKIVGLDFLLTTDSLDKDTNLEEAIANTRNVVQAVVLHDFIERSNYWEDLEVPHSKFRHGNIGFSNFTITDDSICVPGLPMRQYHNETLVYAFSYAIAKNSFGVKAHAEAHHEHEIKDLYFPQNAIGRYFKVLSMKDLLTGNFKESDFKNKIVLMGHVTDNESSFFQNRERTRRISGVEIQASFIERILNN
jgi:CHASE2 domain-containing sensor protein